MSDEGTVFGRGIAFPPRVVADGSLGYSAGSDNVRESIRIILMTDPGERVMLAEFGGGLRRFLFAPNTVATHRAIEEAITRSIARWEPRTAVASVEVEAAPDDARAAIATIRYTLVATRAQGELTLRVPVAPAGS
jgi:phage baseplate assembly protein W